MMKSLRLSVAMLVILIALSSCFGQKGWIENLRATALFRPLRDVNVLTTTKDDVRRLYRNIKTVGYFDSFDLKDGEISIEYTDSECSYNNRTIPPGVVERVSFYPSNWERFSKLRIPIREFTKTTDGDALSILVYTHVRAGLRFEVQKDRISGIDLIVPDPRKLTCSE